MRYSTLTDVQRDLATASEGDLVEGFIRALVPSSLAIAFLSAFLPLVGVPMAVGLGLAFGLFGGAVCILYVVEGESLMQGIEAFTIQGSLALFGIWAFLGAIGAGVLTALAFGIPLATVAPIIAIPLYVAIPVYVLMMMDADHSVEQASGLLSL